MTQYATEIEKKLDTLKQHNIVWFHDLEGGGGSYYEITKTTNFYYFVLHSEVKMDDKALLQSISSDAMEFHRIFEKIGWQPFEKFDSSTYSLKRLYKIHIQCILSKDMFEENYKISLTRDNFMKMLSLKFKPDTYNLSNNSVLQSIRENLLNESFDLMRTKNSKKNNFAGGFKDYYQTDDDFYNPYDLGGDL